MVRLTLIRQFQGASQTIATYKMVKHINKIGQCHFHSHTSRMTVSGSIALTLGLNVCNVCNGPGSYPTSERPSPNAQHVSPLILARYTQLPSNNQATTMQEHDVAAPKNCLVLCRLYCLGSHGCLGQSMGVGRVRMSCIPVRNCGRQPTKHGQSRGGTVLSPKTFAWNNVKGNFSERETGNGLCKDIDGNCSSREKLEGVGRGEIWHLWGC